MLHNGSLVPLYVDSTETSLSKDFWQYSVHTPLYQPLNNPVLNRSVVPLKTDLPVFSRSTLKWAVVSSMESSDAWGASPFILCFDTVACPWTDQLRHCIIWTWHLLARYCRFSVLIRLLLRSQRTCLYLGTIGIECSNMLAIRRSFQWDC